MRHAWTDLDRQTLRHLRRDCGFTYRMIGEAMGKSAAAVQRQAFYEGLSSGTGHANNPWLPCEDEYILKTEGKVSRGGQSAALGRSPNEIANRVRRLRNLSA